MKNLKKFMRELISKNLRVDNDPFDYYNLEFDFKRGYIMVISIKIGKN
jgi:hypothetical protein